MEICSNCFKKPSQVFSFCPYCGYPNIDIGFKRCAKGHIIYETYKNCPFCHHRENLGKTMLNQPAGENTEGTQTEIIEANTNIKNPGAPPQKAGEIKKQESTDDKTVFASDTDGKTVLEDEADQTILDEEKGEPLPRFFAWLVYIDEDDKPLQDIRLTRQKTVIGKSADADIQLNDQFASKLHTAIYFEQGKFFISDLGSSNHTWLNEKKIMNEELNDGDKIRVGHQNIIFKRVRRNLWI